MQRFLPEDENEGAMGEAISIDELESM